MEKVTHKLFGIAKDMGKSQKEISGASGISEESLSRAKKRGSMSADSLEKIAESMGYVVILRKQTPPRLGHAASTWSSPSTRNSEALLYSRVSNASFLDLVELCLLHGQNKVEQAMEEVKADIRPKQYSMQRSMLENIKLGLS